MWNRSQSSTWKKISKFFQNCPLDKSGKSENFFRKFFCLSYIQVIYIKKSAKIHLFRGCCSFFNTSKNKKLFEKNWKFCLFSLGGVNIAQPIKSMLERFFDGFNDLYHKSVSQTLILSQKTISFMQNRGFATVKKLKKILKKSCLFLLGGGVIFAQP